MYVSIYYFLSPFLLSFPSLLFFLFAYFYYVALFFFCVNFKKQGKIIMSLLDQNPWEVFSFIKHFDFSN